MRSLVVFVVCLEAAAGIRAGAAARKITPEIDPAKPVYMAGFGQNRTAAGVNADLYTRCLALQSGAGATVICSVDSIGLFFDDVQRIRKAVSDGWKRGSVSVIVAATHSHQTPDTMGLWGPKPGVSGLNEAYNTLVINRTAEAALAALRGMRHARLHLARTTSPVLDSFIDDDRPPRLHDSELLVMRLTRRSGQGIATLINWANHPEALGSKNRLLTPDFPMALCRDTESRLGGTTLFVNGALGGMQSPLGAKFRDPRTNELAEKDTFRFAEVIGNKVADLAVEAIENAPSVSVNRISYTEKLAKIPVTNEGFRQAAAANLYGGRKAFAPDGTTSAPVGLLRIENRRQVLLDAAAIPGEMYPELSVGGIISDPNADMPAAPLEQPVKQILTGRYRMLFGVTNDEIGYIIPKREWDEKAPFLANSPKRWYGEVNAVGPEAAPLIADAVRELVGRPR